MQSKNILDKHGVDYTWLLQNNNKSHEDEEDSLLDNQSIAGFPSAKDNSMSQEDFKKKSQDNKLHQRSLIKIETNKQYIRLNSLKMPGRNAKKTAQLSDSLSPMRFNRQATSDMNDRDYLIEEQFELEDEYTPMNDETMPANGKQADRKDTFADTERKTTLAQLNAQQS